MVERLAPEYYVAAFFYNPNIHPPDEHARRLEEVMAWQFRTGTSLVVPDYDEQHWHELVRGRETNRERGPRCWICYEMRLRRTAEYARDLGFDWFTTTLTLSPHKDADRVNEIGKRLAWELGVLFLEADFKKGGGFKRSLELSHKYALYRQNYCGCSYSRRARGVPLPTECPPPAREASRPQPEQGPPRAKKPRPRREKRRPRKKKGRPRRKKR